MESNRRMRCPTTSNLWGRQETRFFSTSELIMPVRLCIHFPYSVDYRMDCGFRFLYRLATLNHCNGFVILDSLLIDHWSIDSKWFTGLYAAFPNVTRDKNREGLIVRYVLGLSKPRFLSLTAQSLRKGAVDAFVGAHGISPFALPFNHSIKI